MSSKKYLIGGILVLAAAVASIPLFLRDYHKFPKNLTETSTPSKTNANSAASNEILGYYNSIPVKRSDLTSRDLQNIFDAENQVYSAVENAIAKKYFDSVIEKYMKDKSISDRNAAEQMYLRENVKVTDSEVKAFVKQNAENPQLKGKTEKQQEDLVRPYLTQQAAGSYFKSLVAKATADGKIQITGVKKPQMPRIQIEIGNAPFLGPKEAPITIVEFADFQCPYCSMVVPTVTEIMKKYNGKVRLVFKNFPLSFHDQAMNAAIAAECAQDQGKYWQMHDKLFENHSHLNAALYEKLAGDLKLDVNKFKACLADQKVKAHIESELNYGQTLGITATPAFYINGVQLMGALPKEEFEKVIDEELSHK